MSASWFAAALLPDGWAERVRITIAGERIASIERGCAARAGDEIHGIALPGLPNLHSHSFQRLMAGMAEAAPAAGQDDFWGWRALMYRLVERLSPDEVAAVAAMAFAEMLERGFTRVGEFHYLHHQPSGVPYAAFGEMAAAIAEAADESGIALTLLPVFYAHGGFGGAPTNGGQRRFVNSIDGFASLVEASRVAVATLSDAIVGVAPHSLRAVAPGELAPVIEIAAGGPVHIHVAEQVREVEDCVTWSGARPVRWLLDHAAVDARWCLVHATHVDEAEVAGIVASKAVVGLCPVTEANLGDGIFPASAFARAGGRYGLGTDSNVAIDAAEEMRLLEYGQRLVARRRTVMATGGRSTGRSLFDAALAGGGQALGVAPRTLAAGQLADIVSLSADPAATGDQWLDRWIFAGGSVDSVWRAGRKLVSGGRHVRREAIERTFAKVAARAFT